MYEAYYQLLDALAEEIEAVAPVELYNVDEEKQLADCLNRLAQPLADGSSSPFSARNPLSGEGLLHANFLYILKYFAHEMNLIPDALLFSWMRILGLTREIAVAPTIELEFKRLEDPSRVAADFVVRAGTKIRSIYYADRYATVLENTAGTEGEEFIKVVARIDNPGRLTLNVREGEFTTLPIALVNDFEFVTNTQVLSLGKDIETIPELMERARSTLSRPGNRVITARDYQEVALASGGASKAIALPRLGVKEDGTTLYYGDLVTVAVYPETTVDLTRSSIEPLIPASTRLEVIPGRIIPINGTISIGINPAISVEDAFNLVATAIVDRVNPPYGFWGDNSFIATLSSEVEKIEGIYSIKVDLLKHSETGVLLENLQIQPYDLLQIQDTIEFNWIT